MRRPLPFFLESAFQYAQNILEKGKHEETALNDARFTWRGNDYMRGECEEVHYQSCFGDKDPFDEQFQSLALEILEPLLKARNKGTR